MMETNASLSEIKTCLEDHGLYEKNMSEEEMREYYKAIKNSENTANEEKAKQMSTEFLPAPAELANNQMAKSFSPKQWKTNEANTSANSNNNNNENKLEEEEENIPLTPSNAETTTFMNFLPSSEKRLEIVYHVPKFDLPIPTNEKYTNLPLKEKMLLLNKYQALVNSKRAILAKRSIYPAPEAPPITQSKQCKSSMLISESTTDNTSDLLNERKYTTRAGRHTKRKVYDEEIESDSDYLALDKEPTVLPSKRNKVSGIDIDNEIPDIAVPDELTVPVKDTTKIKPKPAKKVSNAEIMSRSSLFASTSAKKSKAEVLFDKVKEEEKDKQKEAEMEVLIKSLSSMNDGLEEVRQPVEEDEGIEVDPTATSPSLSKSRRRANQQDAKTPSKTNTNAAAIKPGYRRLRRGERALKMNDNMETHSVSIACPICNKLFLPDNVEKHASTCGDNPKSLSVLTSASAPTIITCELCDKVCANNAEYLKHTKLCVSSNVK